MWPSSSFVKKKGKTQCYTHGLRMELSDSVRYAEHTKHNLLKDGGEEANRLAKALNINVRRRVK